MTHLRKIMLEELERRNYSAGTIRRYLRFVERFAKHFGKSPDKLGPDHLRSYQAYLLTEQKLCPGTVENHVAALRFFFIRTLHRHEFRQSLPYPNVRRKLPNILSREEVAHLIEASSSLFQRTLLMVLYPRPCCLPPTQKRRRPDCIFSEHNTQLACTPVYASPCTSRRPTQNSGPSGSLLLSRRTLSFPASCRFIPAH